MSQREIEQMDAQAIMNFLRTAPKDAVKRVSDIITGYQIAQELSEDKKHDNLHN